MTKDLPIRIATMADEDNIMRLTRLVHEEIGRYSYDEDKVRQVVHRALSQKLAIIGVIGEPGDIRACACLLFEPLWYSTEWQIHELWNFVTAEYRKTDYGSRLIKWAKAASDESGLDLFMGLLNDIRIEAKTRMYERLLPKAGAFFLYRASVQGDDKGT